jgi:serpin B
MSRVRMIPLILSSLVLAGFLMAGCQVLPQLERAPGKVLQSKARRDMHPEVSPLELDELVAGNNAFAFDFYRAVRADQGNLFFSPHSLSVALAMTYAGARNATAQEMALTLHYTLPQDRLHPAFNALDLGLASLAQEAKGKEQPFVLHIVNALWGQQDFSFLPEFLDGLARHYGAGMRLLDFKTEAGNSRQAINGWVSRETQEKVNDLIPQGGVDEDTRLVLVNAIYFKADWLFPFDANNTREAPFTRLDGAQVNAPAMSFERAREVPYMAGQGFQAAELPYVGDTISMLLLVPDAGNFDKFESGLEAAQVRDILAALQTRQVVVILPKFHFDTPFALKDVLVQMGMHSAFDDERADFSGMDGRLDLYIGNVFHKAFVAVDEKGTEAAAASAVVMKEVSAALNLNQIVLNVDRPFIFMIRDKSTGAILFVGRVLDPLQ